MNEATTIPAHIDATRVKHYDIYADSIFKGDPHLAFHELQNSAPGIFWTPENGGHWVVVDPDLMDRVLKTPSIFSNAQTSIPPREDAPKMIPMSLDPPEHLQYRRLMMGYFEPRSIKLLEDGARARAEALVAAVRADGEVEFVEQIAGPLPIKVFMEFMGIPLEWYEDLRKLVTDFFASYNPDDRIRLSQQIVGEVVKLIMLKQQQPGNDMLSSLMAADFRGRQLTIEELTNIGFLLFLAGLDTVTNAMSFGVAHLARNPEFQEFLRANPDRIPDAVEELLRRYTFTHTPRVVVQETELGGVTLKPGEMIWNMLALYGLNEDRNPDPLAVDIDRPKRTHGAFSQGGHICLGRNLGKMELKVLYEVMLRDLPTFRLDETRPVDHIRGGTIMSMEHLWLKW